MKRIGSFLPEPRPTKLPKQQPKKDNLTDLFIDTQQVLKYYLSLEGLKKVAWVSKPMNAQAKEAMIDRIFNFHLCDPSIKPLVVVDIPLFLKSIGNLAPNLKEIVISQRAGCWWQMPTSDIASLAANCPNLERLSFIGCSVDSNALQALKPLQNLKKFGFKECESLYKQKLSPICLDVFADLPILQEINFEGTKGKSILRGAFYNIFFRYSECAITYPSGTRYEGCLKKGLHDGNGTLQSQHHNRLQGIFKENKFISGVAFRRYYNGNRVVSVYEGGWKGTLGQGGPHGQGKHTYFDETDKVNEGTFENNVFIEGFTRRINKDGSKYEGKCKNDLFHGEGILISLDGTKHEGIFYQNYLVNGVITYPSGKTKRVEPDHFG